jgi:Ca2+-binding RTX toxin-like protein
MAVFNEVENGLTGGAGFDAAPTVPGSAFTLPAPPGGAAAGFPYAPTASISGTIATAADQDYFAFQFTAGQVIRLDIDGTTGGADLSLFFYDTTGILAGTAFDQAELDPGSTSLKDPFATFTISTTGLWRVGLQGGSVTPYTLNVSILNVPVTWTGTTGADTLFSESGADTLNGAEGDDSLVAGQGNDLVQGGGGADTIEGDAGGFAAGIPYNDTLRGGMGGDRLVGGFGNDRMEGGDGADTLFGDATDPAQVANAGNDTLYGGAGADSLFGGVGRDLLNGGTEADTLEGGAGADRLSGGDGDDLVYGSTSPTADTALDTLDGGEGNDTLWAESRDRVLGGGGDDVVFFTRYVSGPTTEGVTYLDGGAGNDIARLAAFAVGSERVLFALAADGSGTYRMTGGAPGSEITVQLEGIERVEVRGGGDRDDIRGGNGADLLLGNGGAADMLIGGNGADTIYSYLEPFTFFGEVTSADAVLSGGAGNDVLVLQGNGSSGALSGGTGNDYLSAKFSADAVLNGGAGNDTIEYTGGTMLADGATGNDVLVIDVQAAPSALTLADLGGGEGYATAGDQALDFSGIERIYALGSTLADSLEGGTGPDTLAGGAGADTLRGGIGKDALYGRGVAPDDPAGDSFVWTSVAESAPTLAGRDVLTDWKPADVIDLSAIDANEATPADDAFTFGGTTTNTANAAAGTIRTYVYAGNTYVIAGVNADAARDFQIEIGGVHTLTAANFVL